MSDELNPYPGNLKHHKVDKEKRTPLFGECLLPFGDKAEMVKAYEAARAKDAELIQALVDEVAKWMGPNIDERFRGPEWYKSKSVLDAAAASGFKPSEQ